MSDDEEYYDDDDEDVGGGQYEESLSTALARQWGAAPWYVSSFGIHLVIFAILLLFTPAPKPPKKKNVKVVSEIVEEEIKEEEIIEEPEEVVEETEVDVEVETDVQVETEIEIEAEVTVEEPTEDPIDNTEFADMAVEAGEPATMGLAGAASNGGSKGRFGNRSGKAKKRALKKGGAGKAAQTALDRGLRWLAKVQESDGKWDCVKYGGRNYDPTVTALAQLAFLGAGHSTKFGRYRKNVRASEHWLKSKFKGGRIGNYRYEAAVTMMAMAESYAMNEDKNLKGLVQTLVDDAIKNQSTNGGWGYTPVKDPTAAHVDTSVAGWWMMGLKSAKVAGANIPEKTWDGAKKYFEGVTKEGKSGTVTSGYIGPGGMPSMTAVGLTCLQFLGYPRTDKLVKGQAEALLQNDWILGYDKETQGGRITNLYFYAWYYQALGIFQMGTKSVYWKKFGPKMESILVKLQEKNGFNNGSWPYEVNGKKGHHFEESIGRVGTTAVACLMLEVYYRYEDAHKTH